MTVEYLKLIKIDHENNAVQEEHIDEDGNVRNYVMDIISQITENAGERRYEFKPDELTMRTWIGDIVNGNERDERALAIANRLLTKEEVAQQRYQNITDIQKGILLIAFCKMKDTEYKIIICKADYTEFIEETTGEKKNGLPLKKRIYKSFAANILVNAGTYSIVQMVTFDVNSKQSKYWYDEFLDLKVIHNNEENTVKTFKFLKTKILEEVRKKSKSDYLVLWNSTVGYMRTNREFSMDHYADTVLAPYRPENGSLNMTALAEKAKALPTQFRFDSRFEIVPSKITAKMKNEIKLTDDIMLLLKQNIPHIERVILPHEDTEGTKYVMIKSDDGYKYAESLKHITESQGQ